MTIKTIVTDPWPLLKMCSSVKIDADTDQIARNLLDTMGHYRECIGLAAPQIGYQKRIFVMKYGSEVIVCINPLIINHKPKTNTARERCMSLPGTVITKTRYVKIKVQFLNHEGVETVKKLSYTDARCFQHELDHLNGILI